METSLCSQFVCVSVCVHAKRNHIPVFGSKINFQQTVKALMFYMTVIFYYVERKREADRERRMEEGWVDGVIYCIMLAK